MCLQFLTIPRDRILIHPDNIVDESDPFHLRRRHPRNPSKSSSMRSSWSRSPRLAQSGACLLATSRLKGEPHLLWYLLLKNILVASKFLFRRVAPKHSHPLVACLSQLQREVLEIITECETITDLSFDLARIRELGRTSPRSPFESANPGFLAEVNRRRPMPKDHESCLPDPEISIPTQQLASALLATDTNFLEDDYTYNYKLY